VRIPLDALPCKRHGTLTLRLSAFRILFGLAKWARRKGKNRHHP
jgi:hypothetical protein